jgi:hypothetical protein
MTCVGGIIRDDIPVEEYIKLASLPAFRCVGQVQKDD